MCKLTKLFLLFVIVLAGCTASKEQSNVQSRQITAPKLIKSAPLIYPEEAKARLIQGKVGLFLLLDTLGTVKETHVVNSSGSSVLDSAASVYSKSLVFEPIKEESIPIVKWLKWDVSFKLEEKKSMNGYLDYMNVLVYSRANRSKHESRAAGVEAIKKLSENYNFKAEFTEDSTYLTKENLKKYKVVVFLSTSGNVVDQNGKEALQNYIRNGGGYVGIHAASTTEYEWEWYGKLVGAFFDDHPKIQEATINVVDRKHPSTKHLPEKWVWTDEWYNWRSELSKDIKVLLTVDESTYEGGKHSGFHPIAWYHEFDGGRAWYTALGHSNEHYSDPNFLKHILGGIIWAANGGYSKQFSIAD